MIKQSLTRIFIALLLVSLSERVLADWSANFQPPDNNASQLKVLLPDNLEISTLITLGVELDGIDITALISFENQDFVYTPVEPLLNGEHVLRLMVINSDGSFTEKSSWKFPISAAETSLNNIDQQQTANAEAWLKSASFQADTLTEYSNRIKQNNIGLAPDHSIISGSGNVQGNLEGENWAVHARGNYLIQSDEDLALTGKTIDIGEYAISANYTGDSVDTGLTLGHHDIGLDSMLFSSTQRRGVSAGIGDKNNRISTNIFAFNPETQVGAEDFTGLADSKNRLDGVTVTVKPFSAESDALEITGLYYDGQGSTGGIGIGGEEEVSTGSGYGVILKKSFLEGKVDLRGEYDRANYDIDGDEGIAPEDSSDAISLLIEARPFDNKILFDEYLDVVVGTKYERIDTFFDSLANHGIAADRDAVTVYSNIYWGSLSASLQFGHETNNVDELAGIATDRLRSFIWSSNYSFDPQTGKTAWLGSPYLSFSGLLSKLDRKETPDGYEGYDTDNTSNSLTLGGGSSYEKWYWSASHTYASLEDDANTTSDATSNFSSVGLGWTVSDRLELNSDVQYGVFEDKGFDDTSYNTNMNFGLRSVLIRDKLNLDFNYNLNLASGSDDSPDKHVINTELGWTVQQARKNHPGLALTLRGSMETNHENTNNSDDEAQYQIFAIFQITAPFSSGR